MARGVEVEGFPGRRRTGKEGSSGRLGERAVQEKSVRRDKPKKQKIRGALWRGRCRSWAWWMVVCWSVVPQTVVQGQVV